MITLHPYQMAMVNAIRGAYRAGRRAPLLVSPTGSGKTVLFSFMTRAHIERGGQGVIITAHRAELLEQISLTLQEFEVPHGVNEMHRRVGVWSVFTLINRLSRLPYQPSLIICDEAHHAAKKTTWGKVLGSFEKAYKLGVTATPVRLSGEGLADSFDTMIHGPTTQQLIDQGYLSRFRLFCPSTPDLSGVHKRGGDYVAKEVEILIDKPKLTGDAVEHYARHARDRQAVAFCISVSHAKHVAQQFSDAGFTAQCIDGAMPEDWRRAAVRDFREGRLKILTSCDLISEGFDVPNIQCGISLRPTQSVGLWLQQFGRCLRVAPGKEDTVFLDHAGNALRHGLPTDDRSWSLAGSARGSSQSERSASVRICKSCFAANRAGAIICAGCGQNFETIPREVPKKKGTLQEYTPEQIAALAERRRQGTAQSLEALIALGKMRGYKEPERWAEYVWANRSKKRSRSTTNVYAAK